MRCKFPCASRPDCEEGVVPTIKVAFETAENRPCLAGSEGIINFQIGTPSTGVKFNISGENAYLGIGQVLLYLESIRS